MEWHVKPPIYIYTLGVQKPLIQWPFRKDHYFSRDLQLTIPGDYYFNGLWLTGYTWSIGHCILLWCCIVTNWSSAKKRTYSSMERDFPDVRSMLLLLMIRWQEFLRRHSFIMSPVTFLQPRVWNPRVWNPWQPRFNGRTTKVSFLAIVQIVQMMPTKTPNHSGPKYPYIRKNYRIYLIILQDCSITEAWPIVSMYGIFTYIYH